MTAGAEELLAIAERAAVAAGELLAGRFGGPAVRVEHKSSATDPVSDADRDAELLIRGLLEEARPGDAVLGEEGGATAGTGSLLWVLDPLDGTVNYLYGYPAWCVSVACEDEQGPLAAVVHDPVAGETFAAARGRGTTLNGDPVAVRDPVPLNLALVGTGFGYVAEQRERQGEVVRRMVGRIRDVRRGGSAALDLAWVAAGRLDGYFEHGVQRWDVAAGLLLVREAGGTAEPLAAAPGLPPGAIAAGPGLFGPLRSLVEESTAA